jgi:hypothetical protein
MNTPEIYVEQDLRARSVKIWSGNVSSLALHCMQQKVINNFRGEAINQNTIDAIKCFVCSLVNQMIYCELLRLNRWAKYEVCGWISDAEPKDYYRYFLRS